MEPLDIRSNGPARRLSHQRLVRRLSARRNNRWRGGPCHCSAYYFPHREFSGKCEGASYGWATRIKVPHPLEQLADCADKRVSYKNIPYPVDDHVARARIVAPIFRKHGLRVRVVRSRYLFSYVAVYKNSRYDRAFRDRYTAAYTEARAALEGLTPSILIFSPKRRKHALLTAPQDAQETASSEQRELARAVQAN